MNDVSVEKKRRTRVEPKVRRLMIIEATMKCIARHGDSGTTMERICEEAGISIGLIGHHFSSKEELMLCTYQSLTDQLRLETERLITHQEGSAVDRLNAMIRSAFKRNVFNEFTLTTWLGFWGATVSSPELKKLNRKLYSDYRAELQLLFEQAAEEVGIAIDGRAASLTLTALMDGFWLEWTLDQKAFSAAKAQSLSLQVAAALLSSGWQPHAIAAT